MGGFTEKQCGLDQSRGADSMWHDPVTQTRVWKGPGRAVLHGWSDRSAGRAAAGGTSRLRTAAAATRRTRIAGIGPASSAATHQATPVRPYRSSRTAPTPDRAAPAVGARDREAGQRIGPRPSGCRAARARQFGQKGERHAGQAARRRPERPARSCGRCDGDLCHPRAAAETPATRDGPCRRMADPLEAGRPSRAVNGSGGHDVPESRHGHHRGTPTPSRSRPRGGPAGREGLATTARTLPPGSGRRGSCTCSPCPSWRPSRARSAP